MNNLSDIRLLGMGQNQFTNWNRKLCFEARDTLYECVEAQSNKNKYRCPDQLYAYEMYCPGEFRTLASEQKRRNDLDEQLYDSEWMLKYNRDRQTVTM